MKRSEMLSELKTVIAMIRRASYEEFDNDAAARAVLNTVENKGMLPPDQNAHEEPPCEVLNEWSEE